MNRDPFDLPAGGTSIRRIVTACGFVAVVAGSIGARQLLTDDGLSIPGFRSTALGDPEALVEKGCRIVRGIGLDGGHIVLVQAQPEPRKAKEAKKLKGSYDQPLKKRSDATSTVTMHMSQSDGDNTCSVSIENGEVSAKVNGKPVSDDRVRRSDDKVEVLDEHGGVIAAFNIGVGGDDTDLAQVFRLHQAEPGAGDEMVFQFVPQPPQAGQIAEPPRVMLGVTMSPVSGEQANDLGLEEGQGVRIDSVIDGTPADRCGLQEGDIVVRAGGKRVNTETLREILRAHEPGDTVGLVVIRDGEKREIEVELAAWDEGKFGGAFVTPMPPAAPGAPQDFYALGWNHGFQNDVTESVRKAIEEALAHLHKQGQEHAEEARRALEQALKTLHEQHEGTWWQRAPQGGGGTMLFGPRGEAYAPPRNAEPRAADFDRRLEELDRRIDAVDQRLDRILNMLEKMERDRR